MYAYSGFMLNRKKKKALCRRYFRLCSPLITRMANIELFVFRSLLRKYCGCCTLWDKSGKKHMNVLIVRRQRLRLAGSESHVANFVSILYICRVLGHLSQPTTWQMRLTRAHTMLIIFFPNFFPFYCILVIFWYVLKFTNIKMLVEQRK